MVVDIPVNVPIYDPGWRGSVPHASHNINQNGSRKINFEPLVKAHIIIARNSENKQSERERAEEIMLRARVVTPRRLERIMKYYVRSVDHIGINGMRTNSGQIVKIIF